MLTFQITPQWILWSAGVVVVMGDRLGPCRAFPLCTLATQQMSSQKTQRQTDTLAYQNV